ncbi:MAG: wax ester/triacylglycerol synthase family O-acyltransferase [Actinobacteria bacterium]|nr:wax ester/triacylglycerol synthase family O-acyltransferase [Actinomycetota bacterium]
MPPVRLTAQDAQYLYLERPNQHMHVGGVMVLDPSTGPGGALRFEDLVAFIGSRLHLAPRFRQRVLPVPGNVARPVWADDADFDVEFHMRRAALPHPGGRRELADYVQRVMSRPLDRSKPLWEMYFIEGLEDGMVALLTKVHHCMIDGISAIDLATVMFDFTPEPQVLSPERWTPDPEPSRAQLLLDALREQAVNPVSAMASAARTLATAPARAADTVGAVVSGARDMLGMGTPPKGPFDVARIGPNRRFAMAEAPVQRFKDVKHALGGTVNDVILCTVAGGLHGLLKARREPTRNRTLRAMVPVSVRADAEKMVLGNRVSMIFVDLPVGAMSAARRLSLITEHTKDLKESMMAVSAETIVNLGTWAPPTLHALAARLVTRARWFNLVVSNVPGPQVPMYVAGSKLVVSYPIMPLAENVALSVAVTSLAGTMGFGLSSDWDALPEIDFLAAAIQESLDDLTKAAEQA